MKATQRAGAWLIVLWCGARAVLAAAASQTVAVPVLSGAWWQIAERNPLDPGSPWYSNAANACDFTIYPATNGQWQLTACIRGTAYPGETRLFYRWQSHTLTNRMWTRDGVFATSNTNAPLNQWPGVMQAPHCFTNDGSYWFFYNGAYPNAQGNRQGNAAFLKTSMDGVNFNDTTNIAGDYRIFLMGRDVNVFHTTNDTWIAYYCGTAEMVARTAPALRGPWSAQEYSLGVEGNPESPFVLRRGTNYYLWQQMSVYHALDPMNFDVPKITKMTGGLDHGKYAPEILSYAGQDYIAGYDGNGIWLSYLRWETRTVTPADLAWLEVQGKTLTPAFAWTSAVYQISGVQAMRSATVRFIPCQHGATAAVSNDATLYAAADADIPYGSSGEYRTNTVPLAVGTNTITLTLTAAGAVTSKTYQVTIVSNVPEPVTAAAALLITGMFRRAVH